MQDHQAYKANISSGPTHDSQYTYAQVGGSAQLTQVTTDDGRPRTVTFRNDMNGQAIRRDEADNNGSVGDPHEVWYRFAGKQIGFTGNNGDPNGEFANSPNGPFGQGGSTSPTTFTDFDLSVTSYAFASSRSAASTYIVEEGDTLESIAAQLWGDSSLWFELAEANGLQAGAELTAGQTLIIPAGVVRSAHNANTFAPYDPGEVINPITLTSPKPPKQGKGCGAFGTVVLVVIAVVVAVKLGPHAAKFFAQMFGASAKAAAAAAAVVEGTAAGALVGSPAAAAGVVAGGASAAAAGSIVSQAIGVAVGIQDKFSWNAVALAAISGGVGAKLGLSGVGGSGAAGGAIRGAMGSAITQGVAVATGLQKQFSWAGVAAAGVSGAVIGHFNLPSTAADSSTSNIAANAGASAAAAIAAAAARSLIEGSDFGDNVLAALPDVIGQTIGQAIAGRISQAAQERALRRAAIERNADGFRERFGDTSEVEEYREAGLAAAAHPSSREARARFDQAARAMLDANRGDTAVAAFLNNTDPQLPPLDIDGGDETVVTGDRDYLLGPTIDRAGIWVGEVRHEIGQAVGQYIEDNPGVGIALQLADAGLAIAGPARYLGGQVLGHFEEQAAGFIADQMDGPRMWARDMAENGGHGFVFAGSVILGGLGALGIRVDTNSMPSNFGNVRLRGNPLRARFDALTGVARNARWITPRQGVRGPGLRHHAEEHAADMGLSSRAEYDLSARETIQNGRSFTYRDRASGDVRVGYFHEGRFTATSETRSRPAILTHYAMSWEEAQRLPGFANRR